MPIVKIENIHEGVSWGLWKIEENYEFLMNSIPVYQYELVELNKISNQKRKMEWLGARTLLRTMLEKWDLPYNGLIKDSHDKPFLQERKPYISLAHCFPYAAIILDRNNPCGIDIEKPKQTLFHIAHKFLHQEEAPYINGNIERLCVAWAAKEVLYKIQGKKHLSFQENIFLDPFDLEPHRMISAKIRKDGILKNYSLRYEVFDGHYICYNT